MRYRKRDLRYRKRDLRYRKRDLRYRKRDLRYRGFVNKGWATGLNAGIRHSLPRAAPWTGSSLPPPPPPPPPPFFFFFQNLVKNELIGLILATPLPGAYICRYVCMYLYMYVYKFEYCSLYCQSTKPNKTHSSRKTKPIPRMGVSPPPPPPPH